MLSKAVVVSSHLVPEFGAVLILIVITLFVADGMTRNEVMAEVQTIEQEIQRRLPIGSQAPVVKIKNDFLQQGYSEAAIIRALGILGRREILQFRSQGKVVFRQAV
jgi:DNA replication licensing factor MCM5